MNADDELEFEVVDDVERHNVMRRYYGILSNDHRPILIEKLNTGALYKRHGDHGFAILTANRSDADSETNERKTRELISDLRDSGYRYLPVYGGYIGTDGVEDDYEPSFILFPYDTRSKSFADFEPFKKLVLELCGKYNQDSVLVMEPNGTPNYYDRDGMKVNKSSSLELFLNDPHRSFFTSFKDKAAVDAEIDAKMMSLYKRYARKHPEVSFEKFKKDNMDKIKNIGRRFTMDIRFDEDNGRKREIFLNPNPTTRNEKMRRMLSGEILLCELEDICIND